MTCNRVANSYMACRTEYLSICLYPHWLSRIRTSRPSAPGAQVGNEPSVNSVCFCFPLPFFRPTVSTAPQPASAPALAPAPAGGGAPAPPEPHAGVAGAELPRIFCSVPLCPPTAALARLGAAAGSSGKRFFESSGGGGRRGAGAEEEAAEEGAAAGVGTGWPDAEADQAVLRCGWRKPGLLGGGAEDGCRTGKRSGGRE